MRVDLDKLYTVINQFGGNAWRFFTPVDTGWESVMLRGVTISDREFVEVLSRFPHVPSEQAVIDELARRGIWLDDQETTPEQPSAAEPAQPVTEPEQPTRHMSDEARRRRNRLHAAVDRAEASAEKRRGR